MQTTTATNLEIQFLKVLLEHAPDHVQTTQIAREAGWHDLFDQPQDVDAAARFIGRKLELDGLVTCWLSGTQWYAKLGVD